MVKLLDTMKKGELVPDKIVIDLAVKNERIKGF